MFRSKRLLSSVPNIPSEFVPPASPARVWASSPAAAMFSVKQQQQQQPSSSTQLPFVSKNNKKASKVFAEGTATFRETEAAVEHYEHKTKPYKNGWFSLPSLDYSIVSGGISPLMSPTQAQLLRDVHHGGIVRRLNDLTLGTMFEGHPLDAVILHSSFDAEHAAVHTAACEHWNHSFMWRSLLPFGAAPSGKFRHALTTTTLKQQSEPALLDARQGDAASSGGSAQRASALAAIPDGVERCKRMLTDACRDAAATGGGWVFLVTAQAGQNFEVLRYRPGLSPVTAQLTPLLCINMQYHARYVDYGAGQQFGGSEAAAVQAYVDNALKALNWKVAEGFWRRASLGEGGDEKDEM